MFDIRYATYKERNLNEIVELESSFVECSYQRSPCTSDEMQALFSMVFERQHVRRIFLLLFRMYQLLLSYDTDGRDSFPNNGSVC